MALGGVSRTQLELNKAMRIAAERLHEIVVLKNNLENTEKQRKRLQGICGRLQDKIRRRQDTSVEAIGIANRALRAEVMASWMEAQLIALNQKPDYTFRPEIETSPAMEDVLGETSWLKSADDIAEGFGEQQLRELAGAASPQGTR